MKLLIGKYALESHFVPAHHIAVVGQKENDGIVPDPQKLVFGDHCIVLREFGALACFVVGAVVAVGGVFLLEGRFIGKGLLVIAGGKFEIVGWKAVGPSGFAEEGRVW